MKISKKALFRIRIGRATFINPHYVTSMKSGEAPYVGTVTRPYAWKRKHVAEKHLATAKQYYKTAELEMIEPGKPPVYFAENGEPLLEEEAN